MNSKTKTKISGYSVNGNTSLFQSGIGGSTPTYPHSYKITLCKFSDIRHIFEEFHYKGGHMGGGISFCLALIDVEGKIVGGSVIGKPRHEKKYVGSVEIRRMACLDECPKNTESFFLSKVVWYIKKNTSFKSVISYADTSVGHQGGIYKAANFIFIGKTSESKHVFWNGVRYHPRSLTIDRPYSYRLREAIKTGEAIIETGTPKNIFIYKIT
jgi:hypothetical protein